jgi:hypothetical protein
MRGNFGWVISCSVVAGLVVGSSALAVERDFSIVTNQSSIAISGTVTTSFGTVPIQPQGTGSLTTSYTGTVKTDLGTSAITFLSGSSVNANVNGNWKPDSNANDVAAAADYGGKIAYTLGPITLESANFAGRNFVAGVTSSALPLDSGGHFDLSSANVNFASGNLAYHDSSGNLIGTLDIAGKSSALSGTGTLSSVTQTGNTTATLTVPVDSTFEFSPQSGVTIDFTLTGQLVGTVTFAAGLSGDFNSDGKVDAADYVVWSNGVLVAKTTANYNLWRVNFGAHAGSGAASSFAAVPEASAAALGLLAFVANVCCWRARKA